MPRNFKKRAEILYPINNTELKTRIMDEILMTYLKDNVKARLMQPDGIVCPDEAEGRGKADPEPERTHRDRPEGGAEITAL